MGALRGVYQLKPQPIHGAAFLRIRDNREQAFSEKYLLETDSGKGGCYNLFENVVAQVSEDGKVLKFGMIQEERILDLQKPGIYLLIQSMNKRGFHSDFVEKMQEWAAFLEDQLFYVTYDTYDDSLLRFELKNGELHFRQTEEMKQWNYDFRVYLEVNYASDKQLLADYFTDEMVDLKVACEDMVLYGSDPDDYFEKEEYEEFLEKLERYTETNQNERAPELITWLKDKIGNYHSLEERQKDADAEAKE